MLNVTYMLCGSRAGVEAPVRKVSACGCGSPRPLVAWAVTRACNLRCLHCHANAASTPGDGELSFTEGLRLLNDLRRFEVPAVLFAGGEPLAREDACDLMEHAGEIGLNITLATNGTLIDDRMADRLAGVGLGYAGISIDGSPQRHDRLRDRQGAHRSAVEAIHRCLQRGIRVGVRYTIHQHNHMDLDAVFDLCLEHDVHRLCVHHLSGCGRDSERIDLNPTQRRAVMDRIFTRTRAAFDAGSRLEVLTVGNTSDASYMLLTLEKSDPRRFHEARRALAAAGGDRAGCEIAGIDPVGNVHYDPDSWHYTCGNVRERSFADIWADPDDPRLRILRDRHDHLPERCQICRFVGICNGNSRTRAEAATGDWLAPDPACYISAPDLGLTVPAECIIPDLHAQRHQWTADAL